MQDELHNLLKRAIIYASEMALVEEAHGTARYLEQLNKYLRYMTRDMDTVLARDEIRALEYFAELSKPHHVLEISVLGESGDVFVEHGSIIRFIEACYRENWERCAANIAFIARIELKTDGIAVIFLATDEQGRPIRLEQTIEAIC